MNAAASSTSASAAPSRWRQFRHTPWRDILRGRLSGRLDVERLITSAPLPPEQKEVVTLVVRRTRLWRSERVEVARELIAHFQDGLEAGRSPGELAQSFGDLKQAAILMRRAKKRSRPLAWRAGRRVAQALALLIALYVLVALRFVFTQPSISHNYVIDLNQSAASIPPTQQGWPLYRQALVELRQSGAYDAFFKTTDDMTAIRPGDESWPQMMRLLAQNREQLALIRRAASRPGFGFEARHRIAREDRVLWPEQAAFDDAGDPPLPPLFNDSMFALLLPYLGDMRSIARLLRLDMRRAAAEGDAEGVLNNIDAMLGLARHAREIPLLINYLVGHAVMALALEQVGDVLDEYPSLLSEAQLQQLAHRLAAIDERDLAVRLDGERLGFKDVVQRMYSDDGKGDGGITWEGLKVLKTFASASGVGTDYLENAVDLALLPGMSLIVAGRRELLREYHALMDSMEAEGAVPLWRRPTQSAEQRLEQWKGSPLDRARLLPIVVLAPAVSKAVINTEYTIQRRDAAMVVIALELHRRRSGDWPPSLNELVPTLLPAVPPDRFDGGPLKYALVNGRPLLYSVGTNRADDGGTPARSADGRVDSSSSQRWIDNPQRAKEVGRGDWIFWPPIKSHKTN